MKRPAFQFYPADWQKDAALQSCSVGARGLWIEMMCIMHQCEPYGHLAVNCKPMSPEQLGRLVGETPTKIKHALAELDAAGVFSRGEDGCIFSRRMVKDERLRNVRAEAGKLGGNPNLLGDKVNQKVKPTDNHTAKQSPTPSSSSSSLEVQSQKLSPSDAGFSQFWTLWPKHFRKQSRGKCETVWKRKGLSTKTAEVLAHVQGLLASQQWRDPQFIPAPLVYLNEERWDGAELQETAVRKVAL